MVALWQRIRSNMYVYATVMSIAEVLAMVLLVWVVFPQAGMLDIGSILLLLAIAFPLSLALWTRYYKPQSKEPHVG